MSSAIDRNILTSDHPDFKPLVAVWMITYNHESFISQAIEGVLTQKAPFSYKLFIGDDCSKDETTAICLRYMQTYPGRIELLLNPTNVGAVNNAGRVYEACLNSGAKYIAMCEGDDYWTDIYKLKKQVLFLEQNKSYSLCHHDIAVQNTDINPVVEPLMSTVEKDIIETFTIEDLANGNFIYTPSAVFRREVIEQLPSWFTLSPIGDYSLFMMAGRLGNYGCIKQVMGVYRAYNGVWSGALENEKFIKYIHLVSLLQEEFKDLPTVRARLLWKMVAHQQILLNKGCHEATGYVENCIPGIVTSFEFVMNECKGNFKIKKLPPTLKSMVKNKILLFLKLKALEG